MKYLRQIYYEMCHQKMMTWVSVSGTALSIFLVMVFFMTDQILSVEVAPETRRQSIYIGQNIHLTGGKWQDSSGSMHYNVAKEVYSGLENAEMVSFMTQWNDNSDVNVKGGETVSAFPKNVDQNFWKLYEFTFIDGKPFDEADVQAGVNKIVVSQSLARTLFGEDHVSGREVMVDMMPYTIAGVVKDVSPLLSMTYADFYKVFDIQSTMSNETEWFGNSMAAILIKDGSDYESLKNEVKSRYATLNNQKERLQGSTVVYHEQPYTAETYADGGYGSNNSPDTGRKHTTRWILYSVLILLPAINLSSMTRSRLRHRVSEIGVRRAFGARRMSIIGQMIGENMIISLLGGILGLLLAMVFVLFASNLFFLYSSNMMDNNLVVLNARPTFEMLFTWQNFFIALGLCFILNLLSATVPSWQASRVVPAEAIAKVK